MVMGLFLGLVINVVGLPESALKFVGTQDHQ